MEPKVKIPQVLGGVISTTPSLLSLLFPLSSQSEMKPVHLWGRELASSRRRNFKTEPCGTRKIVQYQSFIEGLLGNTRMSRSEAGGKKTGEKQYQCTVCPPNLQIQPIANQKNIHNKKIPESSKKQSLNVPCNYLHRLYIV